MRSLAAVGRSTYHSPRMESILTLAAAVALGLGTLVAANQLMRAADHPGRPRRVLASLWLPLCMVIPTVGLVAPIGVSGSGSLVDSLDALLIVPLGVLVAVPPILLFRSRWSHPDWHADDHVPLAWPAIGTMLLLLAVAGSGPQFLLIVACAAGLVFVLAETVPRMYEGHGGPGAGWVLVCLGAATGLAVVARRADDHVAVRVVILAVSVLIPLLAARRLGRRTAILAGGWAAALAPVAMIGVIGQDGLRVAIQAALGGAYAVVGYPHVDGMEALAAPGAAVLILSGIIAGWSRTPIGRGRVVASVGWLAGIASIVVLATLP